MSVPRDPFMLERPFPPEAPRDPNAGTVVSDSERGEDDVREETSVMVRFWLYDQIWRLAPGVHGRMMRGSPGLGKLLPASMHRSWLSSSWYAWIRPPLMFSLVDLNR